MKILLVRRGRSRHARQAADAARILRVTLALPTHDDARYMDWVLRAWASSEDGAARRFDLVLRSAGIATALPLPGQRVSLAG